MLLTHKNEITVLKMIPCQPKSPQTTKKEHLNNNHVNDNLKHPGCYVITDYLSPSEEIEQQKLVKSDWPYTKRIVY